MKKFRFKFETILKVKKSREEEALRVLGEAQRAYQQELENKNGLLRELDSALKRRETLAIVPVGVHAFQLEENYITGTKHRLISAERAITRAGRGVEKALRSYLSARRQTKTFETLREKHFSEFKKEYNKWLQKQSDDITTMRRHLKEAAA